MGNKSKGKNKKVYPEINPISPLLDLPPELRFRILKYLDLVDLSRIGISSKILLSFVQDPRFWMPSIHSLAPGIVIQPNISPMLLFHYLTQHKQMNETIKRSENYNEKFTPTNQDLACFIALQNQTKNIKKMITRSSNNGQLETSFHQHKEYFLKTTKKRLITLPTKAQIALCSLSFFIMGISALALQDGDINPTTSCQEHGLHNCEDDNRCFSICEADLEAVACMTGKYVNALAGNLKAFSMFAFSGSAAAGFLARLLTNVIESVYIYSKHDSIYRAFYPTSSFKRALSIGTTLLLRLTDIVLITSGVYFFKKTLTFPYRIDIRSVMQTTMNSQSCNNGTMLYVEYDTLESTFNDHKQDVGTFSSLSGAMLAYALLLFYLLFIYAKKPLRMVNQNRRNARVISRYGTFQSHETDPLIGGEGNRPFTHIDIEEDPSSSQPNACPV